MTNNPNHPIQIIGCKDMEILFVSDTEIKVSIGEPRLGVENTATISDPIDDLPMPHSYLVIKMPKSAHYRTFIIGIAEDPMFCASDRYMNGSGLYVEHCKTASEIESFLNSKR